MGVTTFSGGPAGICGEFPQRLPFIAELYLPVYFEGPDADLAQDVPPAPIGALAGRPIP